MGSKSDYLEAKLLDLVLGANAFTAPATVYLALFSVTPSDAGGGTEATGSGYARLAITNNSTNFPAATGANPATKNNGPQFTWPSAASADWSGGANMTGWGLFDSSSGGNMLHWGTFATPKPVLNGDVPFVPAGAVSITED